MSDVVVFRRWRDTDGDVIALFPEIPADVQGRCCQSYMHIGQHAGGDYHHVIRHTVPVDHKHCVALAEELRRIGYNLRPVRRAAWQHHDKRRETARQFATADTSNDNDPNTQPRMDAP